MNLKQNIEHYEGLTGINQRPEFMNDQQYLDYLIDNYISSKKKVETKKRKKSDD